MPKAKSDLLKQPGTGLHCDCNPYNLWKKQEKDKSYVDLDTFRPFQTLVVCSDAPQEKIEYGGLEVIPGFYHFCEDYFNKHPGAPTHGRNLHRWGTYNCKFSKKHDGNIIKYVQIAQRIPSSWQPPADGILPKGKQSVSDMTLKELETRGIELAKEHEALEYVPVQQGDFVFWDIRTPHQNSKHNKSDKIRIAFYHAYLLAQKDVNGDLIEKTQQQRSNMTHPEDFPKTWRDIEKSEVLNTEFPKLNKMGKLLYNKMPYSEAFAESSSGASSSESAASTTKAPTFTSDVIIKKRTTVPTPKPPVATEEKDDSFPFKSEEDIYALADKHLTERHIAFFQRYGYVVVENLIPADYTNQIVKDVKKKLCMKAGISEEVLESGNISAKKWANVSGKFGGMVEFFWMASQERIRLLPTPYAVTAKLMKNTWTPEKKESVPEAFRSLPWTGVKPYHLWLKIDRLNYRFPHHEEPAEEDDEEEKEEKKKKTPTKRKAKKTKKDEEDDDEDEEKPKKKQKTKK